VMMGSEPLRRLMGWLGSVKSYPTEGMDGAVDLGSSGKSRPSTAGGETEGERERCSLSVAVEALRCNEVESFAPAPSWDSAGSSCSGCGCWSLEAAFFANVFSFALLRVRGERLIEDKGI